eukprot:scaffold238401_cov30-Tisochrysis_lutea.AAC.4
MPIHLHLLAIPRTPKRRKLQASESHAAWICDRRVVKSISTPDNLLFMPAYLHFPPAKHAHTLLSNSIAPSLCSFKASTKQSRLLSHLGWALHSAREVSTHQSNRQKDLASASKSLASTG